MKRLLPIAAAIFCLQSALASSRYVTLTESNPSETILTTDLVEIVGANITNLGLVFNKADETDFGVTLNRLNSTNNAPNVTPIGRYIFTGVLKVSLSANSLSNGAATLKISPAASTEATSKPVMVPPTSASDARVNVQLQVSTDLKNWEDVAPGEFLGSDTLRFFRVKTTTGTSE